MDRLMIVDDQMAIRKLLKEVLEDEFELCFMCSAEEAINDVCSFKPDVILLDIGLSGMSGIDALPILKEKVPECGIVMLTGNIDDRLIGKVLNMGADDYITKPFDIFDIKNKLINIKNKKFL